MIKNTVLLLLVCVTFCSGSLYAFVCGFKNYETVIHNASGFPLKVTAPFFCHNTKNKNIRFGKEVTCCSPLSRAHFSVVHQTKQGTDSTNFTISWIKSKTSQIAYKRNEKGSIKRLYYRIEFLKTNGQKIDNLLSIDKGPFNIPVGTKRVDIIVSRA